MGATGSLRLARRRHGRTSRQWRPRMGATGSLLPVRRRHWQTSRHWHRGGFRRLEIRVRLPIHEDERSGRAGATGNLLPVRRRHWRASRQWHPRPVVRKAPPGRQEARDSAAAAPRGPASSDSPPGPPPPITITRGPNGQLLLSSPDTEALDRLEELIERSAAPSPNDYKIFKLRYAWAYGVASILKDVFKDDEGKEKRRTPWWWDDYSQDDKSDKDKVKLSKHRPLKIISDSDTNSILVQGADASQLKRIDELVKFYDKPEPTDAQSVRKCETFKLRYSQAKVVAETVKDVYRDLLSANDKALTTNQPQQQQPQRSFGWSMFGDDNNEDKGQKVPKFKGLLSIGVDEVSNTIVISAPAYLMQVISKMVLDLDEAAAPVQDTMAVVRIGSGVSTTQIEESLSRMLGQGEKRSRTPRQPQAKPGENGCAAPAASARATANPRRARRGSIHNVAGTLRSPPGTRNTNPREEP